ncbi:MAG: aminotransferase class V-fold PLP-dependent enzyme [Campylobacterales bacterium]|nr:aminotransferase class V-fold PLP-dependent enzyme [Campylobacterales bacterium]
MYRLVNNYIFTPGPVKMFEETLKIGAMQTPYFRNDAFSKITLECEENILKITNAACGSRVLFLTASGTAGMEAVVQNLLDGNDKALVINGGTFGQRFVDICKIHAIDAIDCKIKDTNLTNTSTLETHKNATALLINAHETSIGTLYDLDAVGAFAKENNMFHIVDAISMFITDRLDMQKHHIDALIISSHKGLALPPGLSMVVLSPRAIEKINPMHQLYFDFNSYLKDGARGQTPFTPAITIILQLHQRLEQIVNDSIESEINKAKEIATYFREAIRDLPLKPYSFHMPNAMTILTPTDEKLASLIVKDLDEKYNIIVAPNGGALHDKVFRVAHMGAMTKEYTDILIDALFDYYGRRR